ncbi:UNVERIFIED_ORG: hypothetical protein M2348_001348 [Sphingomonas sp. R1F5B]
MAERQLLDQALLLKLLRYDPDTGLLYWRERDESLFRDGPWNSAFRKCRSWNAKNADKPAFRYRTAEGYHAGAIFGVHVKAHRVIWKMMTGHDADCIDHIDGDRANNKWCNLRSVSAFENCSNTAVYRSNRLGVAGVSIDRGKWRARITFERKTIFLGHFDTMEEAVRARKAAERAFGFHPNHGRIGV